MAYKVSIVCDKCGTGFCWRNYSVSLSAARRIARTEGWSVGKSGDFCPKCRLKKSILKGAKK